MRKTEQNSGLSTVFILAASIVISITIGFSHPSDVIPKTAPSKQNQASTDDRISANPTSDSVMPVAMWPAGTPAMFRGVLFNVTNPRVIEKPQPTVCVDVDISVPNKPFAVKKRTTDIDGSELSVKGDKNLYGFNHAQKSLVAQPIDLPQWENGNMVIFSPTMLMMDSLLVDQNILPQSPHGALTTTGPLSDAATVGMPRDGKNTTMKKVIWSDDVETNNTNIDQNNVTILNPQHRKTHGVVCLPTPFSTKNYQQMSDNGMTTRFGLMHWPVWYTTKV